MNEKKIIDILDVEIGKCELSTLRKSPVLYNFFSGYVSGLDYARSLLFQTENNSGREQSGTPVGVIKTGNFVKPDEVSQIQAPPIPNIDKIIDEYDGILLLGGDSESITRLGDEIFYYLVASKKALSGQKFSYVRVNDTKLNSWTDLGCYVSTYSANNPESVRGISADVLWLDTLPDTELAKETVHYIGHSFVGDNKKVIISGETFKRFCASAGLWFDKLNYYVYYLTTNQQNT